MPVGGTRRNIFVVYISLQRQAKFTSLYVLLQEKRACQAKMMQKFDLDRLVSFTSIAR